MNEDALMIAALVFLVGVAVFAGKSKSVPGLPEGYRYDPSVGAYTRVMPDGSVRWLT